MKRILLILPFLQCAIGFSQTSPIDFETTGAGSTWTWNVFENTSSSDPLQFVNNPSATGINTSSKVAKFTALTGGAPWAGTESAHGSPFGTFTLTASNCAVRIMVYKSVISDVAIKFATPSGGSSGEIKVSNTLVNQWEMLTFNFSGKIGEPTSTGIDQIVVFPDFQTRSTNNICYFDNITFSAQGTLPNAPTTAAPTPSYLAADVISMFSNPYTNVGVNTWAASWSPGTVLDTTIATNATKKYSGLGYVAVETTGANTINATTMTYFHVNVWTPNLTTFRIKLVDFGAGGVSGGGDDVEHELSFVPIMTGWNTYDIPLSSFTGLTTRAHIGQVFFSTAAGTTGVAYVDNVLFRKDPVVVLAVPTVAAPTPTYLAANVISMFSGAYTNVGVDTWRTSWSTGTVLDTTIATNATKKYSGLGYVAAETTGANIINATAMTHFHVNVWTPNLTTFRIKLVDFGANGTFGGGDDVLDELTFVPTMTGWNTYDIPLSSFTALTTRAHIAQVFFSTAAGTTGIAYVDNVLFRNNPVVPAPAVAAPTPTFPASNVISMFSDAYTNVGVDTWRTSWSTGALVDTTIATNATKKYTGLGYVAVETTGANIINATGMTHFYVNAWTPNLTTFRIKLVDFGANGAFGGGDDVEQELTFVPTMNGWNTYDIPLSDFTGLTTRAHIAQVFFSTEAGTTGIAYVDNVLFRKQSSAGLDANEVSAFKLYPNPAGDVVTINANSAIEAITVFDVLGNEVVSTTPNNSLYTMDVASLKTGMYFVHATINGTTSTMRFVKK